MNAEAFRHFYAYHFAENRKLWNAFVVPLTDEQFMRPLDYSIGSVRNQIVHLISVDDAWFSDLRGLAVPEHRDPNTLSDRGEIRAYWDNVEQGMREYLAGLSDGVLAEKPLSGEDGELTLWQILLHVANHGTDHRAQILRQINDMGYKTAPQDYVFYIFDNL